MKKFVPVDKLSKRKQRELEGKRRGTWGAINPVTRKAQNANAYDRKKARRWTDDDTSESFLF